MSSDTKTYTNTAIARNKTVPIGVSVRTTARNRCNVTLVDGFQPIPQL
jgi:hypothetical protein